ncbi:MAG TPA: transcription elongation factor GreA [Dehalococcoidia bacterium]|nr:transcription elongation factor GreA [Dehalococcoidia bacterium]
MAGETTTEQRTLQELAHAYLASLKPAARQGAQPEVLKFVRWAGGDRDLSAMRGHEIAQYAEHFPPTVADAAKRADHVRAFLKWSKDRGATIENLGTHLRVRKAAKSSSSSQTIEVQQPIYLTREGHEALESELDQLKQRRPHIQADLARAMADKDFRENAPLDAARNEQGHLEARIREIDGTLRRAVILEQGATTPGDVSQIGDVVTVRDLRTGAEKSYTLVNSDEVRSGQGKISISSPVGRAVYQRHAGEEVEVEAPSGTFRMRIEAIKST